MNRLIVVLVASLVPTTAMAKNPCSQDKRKFCKGETNVVACLDQHIAELSEACKTMLQAKRNEGSAQISKEEGEHARPQPLTRSECDKSGLKWNDRSNVCG
jgi:hypothetical protein